MQKQFEPKSSGLLVRAPAKINLVLLVAGKRDDGYHELETVMAKIDLFDTLLFESPPGPGVELLCRGKAELSTGPDNLVHKAARAVFAHIGREIPVRITLNKRIPLGAGLGGGSSDAAATILGLNEFAKLALPTESLLQIGAAVGSDVNFFLGGPQSFCTGRGETISEIPKIFFFRAILMLPKLNTSTKMVYERYVHDAAQYARQHDRLAAFLRRSDLESAAQMAVNMLEPSCFALHPELEKLKASVESLGLGRVTLSGSGSALYLLVSALPGQAQRAQSIIRERIGCECITVNNNRW